MRGFFFHRGQHGCEDRAFGNRDGFGRGPHRHGPFGHNGFGGGGNPFEQMGRGFGGRREGRGFGHGGLRLVLLKLLSEKPSHGYELIKAIEERSKGAYSPSPGVIYPTLSWLEDEGFTTVEAGEDGRKMAQITDAGRTFLEEKAEAVDALFAAMDGDDGDGREVRREEIFRAINNLGMTVGLRMRRDPLTREQAQTLSHSIIDLIDDVAKKIERS